MSSDLQYLLQILANLLITVCPGEYSEASLTSRGVYEDAVIEVTCVDLEGNFVVVENIEDQMAYKLMVAVSAIHDDMGEESGIYWSEFKFNLRGDKFDMELSYD